MGVDPPRSLVLGGISVIESLVMAAPLPVHFATAMQILKIGSKTESLSQLKSSGRAAIVSSGHTFSNGECAGHAHQFEPSNSKDIGSLFTRQLNENETEDNLWTDNHRTVSVSVQTI